MKTNNKIILFISSLLLVSVLAVFTVWTSSKTIAYGCFHQVAHKGSGCAALVQKSDGQIVLQLVDFKTTENPDLQILIISATDALENETVKNSEQLFVASLQKSEGFQEYLVPNIQSLTKLKAVVIWNNKHSVNFTTAPLKQF
jgi:hypothetical protein